MIKQTEKFKEINDDQWHQLKFLGNITIKGKDMVWSKMDEDSPPIKVEPIPKDRTISKYVTVKLSTSDSNSGEVELENGKRYLFGKYGISLISRGKVKTEDLLIGKPRKEDLEDEYVFRIMIRSK